LSTNTNQFLNMIYFYTLYSCRHIGLQPLILYHSDKNIYSPTIINNLSKLYGTWNYNLDTNCKIIKLLFTQSVFVLIIMLYNIYIFFKSLFRHESVEYKYTKNNTSKINTKQKTKTKVMCESDWQN